MAGGMAAPGRPLYDALWYAVGVARVRVCACRTVVGANTRQGRKVTVKITKMQLVIGYALNWLIYFGLAIENATNNYPTVHSVQSEASWQIVGLVLAAGVSIAIIWRLPGD